MMDRLNYRRWARLGVGILAVLCLGGWALADVFPLVNPYTIENDFVQVNVGNIVSGDDDDVDDGHEEQKGLWFMRSVGGEPTVVGDETAALTSQWVAAGNDVIEGISGYTRIAIGDPTEAEPDYDYARYGAVGTGDDEGQFQGGGGVIQPDLVETVWVPNAQDYVEIRQAIHLVRDKARIEYTVRNTSTTEEALIGLRLLIDAQRGGVDDGPIFFAQDSERVQTANGTEESFREEREWGTTVDPLRRWFWFFAPDAIDDPQTICGGIVESPPQPIRGARAGVVPPDRVLLVNWPRVYGTEWDITVDQSRFASDDLAIVVFWDPEDASGSLRTIPPGATRTYVFYYGLQSATEDVAGSRVAATPTLVGATIAPFALKLRADQQDYDLPSPEGFTIRADVTPGPGTASLGGSVAAISLPEGLSTVDSRSQSIAPLAARQTGAATWRVLPTGERYGKFVYTVTVTSQGGDAKSISRAIQVPALPTTVTGEVNPLPPPFEGELPGTSYRMFSVPYALTDADALFGLTYVARANEARAVTPRIFSYNPDTGQYDEYPNGSRARQVAPGQGYWLLVGEAVKIIVESGNARPLNAESYVAVPLSADGGGFNQVGCPYTYAIRLRDIEFQFEGRQLSYEDAIQAGWVRGTVWFWDGAARDGRGAYGFFGDPEETLNPWVGYWIKALVDCRMIAMPPNHLGGLPPVQPLGVRSSLGSAGRAREPGSQSDWVLQLVAETGQALDDANFIGVSSRASQGYDPSDIEEPPVIGPFVQLGFPHTNWGRDSGLFTQDIRSASTATSSWDAQVRTNQVGEEVTLSWPTVGYLPRELEAYLEDLQTGKRIFMRSAASYKFVADESGVRDLRITVTPRGGGLSVASLEVAPLARGRGAELAYILSAPAEVDVSVLNAAGRQVAMVAIGEAGVAGRNTVSWDGRGTTGAALPAGDYRVVLTARSDEGGQASAVRTLSLR